MEGPKAPERLQGKGMWRVPCAFSNVVLWGIFLNFTRKSVHYGAFLALFAHFFWGGEGGRYSNPSIFIGGIDAYGRYDSELITD